MVSAFFGGSAFLFSGLQSTHTTPKPHPWRVPRRCSVIVVPILEERLARIQRPGGLEVFKRNGFFMWMIGDYRKGMDTIGLYIGEIPFLGHIWILRVSSKFEWYLTNGPLSTVLDLL